MTLSDLAIWFSLGAISLAVWHHHNVRRYAYSAALRHTKEQGVTLLDQTTVLTRVRIVRSHRALFALERQFEFEFSSIGDERYKGRITFLGSRQKSIRLAPFKTETVHEPIDQDLS